VLRNWHAIAARLECTMQESKEAACRWVIPTNEELMIAQHTLAFVRP
jgi:acetate kinase